MAIKYSKHKPMTELLFTSDAFLFSINKLSEALGVSRDTIRKRLARVYPVKERNGFPVYHLRDCVTLITDPLTDDPEELAPRARKDWYDGELRRVELIKKKGELLEVDEMRREWAETIKSIMLTLETLVDVIERDVGLMPEQIKRIQDIIDNQREILYHKICTQEPIQLSAS